MPPLLSECILFKDGGGKSDSGPEGQPLAVSWGYRPGYSQLTARDVCVCVFVSVALSPLQHHCSNRPEHESWGFPRCLSAELVKSPAAVF